MNPGACFPRRIAERHKWVESAAVDIARLQNEQRPVIQRRHLAQVKTTLLVRWNHLNLRRTNAQDRQRFSHSNMRALANNCAQHWRSK